MIEIPPYYFKIPYKDACYPGSEALGDFKDGANCQVFVYELLVHFGYPNMPDFRSSELWEDEIHSQKVNHVEAYDILFWNKTATAWGAHVGLALDASHIIHLSHENGFAEIWPIEKFETKPNYAHFIGSKRSLK